MSHVSVLFTESQGSLLNPDGSLAASLKTILHFPSQVVCRKKRPGLVLLSEREGSHWATTP